MTDIKINPSVSGKTSVLGIIGSPVEHSFSPVLQNTIARAMGGDSVYVPFHVKKGSVGKAIEGAFALGIQGLNVTVPHKKEVMKHLCRIDSAAQKVGAVNTLKRIENGFEGYNTDVCGLEKAFEIKDINLSGKTCVILGAGGAANSAVAAACEKGAGEIFIVNRTIENGEKLKEAMLAHFSANITVLPYERTDEIDIPHLLIQTTSVGMGSGAWESALKDTRLLEKTEFLLDIIYTPWKTKILHDAEKMGIPAANGFDMLVYQGIASYEIWNSISVPKETAKQIRDTLADYYTKGGTL